MGKGILACLLALALAAAVTPGAALAARDWNRTDDPMHGALGLHLGKVGGVGLAYKYPVVWWLYLQMAGGIWHSGGHERHNLGGELQYVLRQDDRLRLYLAGGAAWFHHRQRETDRTTDHVNTGFGVGVELLHWSRVSLQIEGDFTREGEDGDIIFFPQVGLFFYF
jgi:hypothetical protein